MDEADPLAALDRWSAFGGVWRVLASDGDVATVSLCRCDGGEEVERLVVRDPRALAHLATHPSSESAGSTS
ncbi:hypothetical protein [Ornithinicoccus hortensis]|uniref:Uncharacterized protein n=1 Tax=Ornithinicoccus hortensis TaxID=82346 RepID=A0A542YRW2_9MICO|nr:hypothetical protein [Ornithinicoccus hortensis]TQL50846.1 hypothetical protein FB467_1966 [Ornithinicoccus hortensis]